MISAEDISRCEAFEYVAVRGRAIMPGDPMVADPDYGRCGAPIRKLITGSQLRSTVAKWDGLGRIIDDVQPYSYTR